MALSFGNLSEDAKIVPVLSYASANTDRNSEVIDTAGYGRCCVVVHTATIAAGATVSMHLTHSDVADDENTLNTATNVAGSSQTIADDDDDEVKYIDFEPSKRYYQLTVDKDGTNLAAESAVAVLYQAKDKPTPHATGNTDVGEGTGLVEGENLGMAVDGTL